MSLATTVVAEVAKEILKAGVIEPATGLWSSLVVEVRKQTWLIDYRKRNAATRIDDTRHAGSSSSLQYE
ncbi:hypothetical protein T06_7537 [Trichinella sp. T6]|nr:hypothetical protein T06_7537 [Trichinella sp. T6]